MFRGIICNQDTSAARTSVPWSCCNQLQTLKGKILSQKSWLMWTRSVNEIKHDQTTLGVLQRRQWDSGHQSTVFALGALLRMLEGDWSQQIEQQGHFCKAVCAFISFFLWHCGTNVTGADGGLAKHKLHSVAPPLAVSITPSGFSSSSEDWNKQGLHSCTRTIVQARTFCTQ